jgi:hypothetical protein
MPHSVVSSIGWIDFSDEDQKRAQDYLNSQSEGTLDELGFGIIRDAFTDLFFPATSTIMTRARYYILVPSIGSSGLLWVEIASTAVDVDGYFEILAIAIASNSPLDRHDLTIDSLGH